VAPPEMGRPRGQRVAAAGLAVDGDVALVRGRLPRGDDLNPVAVQVMLVIAVPGFGGWTFGEPFNY